MSKLLIKARDVVVPGEGLAEGMDFLPSNGTYREGDRIFASRLGLVKVDGKVLKVIPLSGIYEPKRGDTIIGKVVDILMSGWRIELGGPYSAILGLKEGSSSFIAKGADLTRYYDVGDYIVTKITNVTTQKLIDVSMRGPGLRKLGEGNIIEVNSSKVPRIIGKQGSMISMIKNKTNCKINVGQNGVIWISGEPEMEVIAIKTIKKIEKEAHTSGLTEKIKEYLEKEVNKKSEKSSNKGEEK
jgi:exosome complex component RRP4